MVDPNMVETYTVGKEGFIVALCEALGVPEIFNQSLKSINGRPVDVPYGIDAMIMMVNMCHDHRALSRLKEYYEYTDLKGLFHYPITLDQINDDRFGGFLDLFHGAGCKKIFSMIAAKAVSLYGIQINNINFDTTSKVMWGQYETSEGTMGVIQMDFGHSKDKREDKKQIKFGIGCANGLVVDAVVFSGNKDDKTYNTDTLNTLDETLKTTKKSKVTKAVEKEKEFISKDSKTLSKGEFACEEDANHEMEKMNSKEFKKLKFHDISYSLRKEERRKRGRPSKDATPIIPEYRYFMEVTSTVNQDKITRAIDKACCFVLCSNDLNMSGEKILREYKTQDSVEKKFQQLKSPQLVNSIYIDSPQRIEAFSYLMLSLAEYVVRRGLSQDGDHIIGPGNVKMKRPTQRAIYDIFYAVRIRVICYPDRPWERSFSRPLNDSLKKVLKYLNIAEKTFIRGCG